MPNHIREHMEDLLIEHLVSLSGWDEDAARLQFTMIVVGFSDDKLRYEFKRENLNLLSGL